MSRTMHIVVQFSLLVIWALILISDSSITASSQSCTQPPYLDGSSPKLLESECREHYSET